MATTTDTQFRIVQHLDGLAGAPRTLRSICRATGVKRTVGRALLARLSQYGLVHRRLRTPTSARRKRPVYSIVVQPTLPV